MGKTSHQQQATTNRGAGQVPRTASAVCEEHASEHGKDSVVAECGAIHALPPVLPAEPATTKTQRLAGRTVLEFVANGRCGDVREASQTSVGEWFAIQVMTHCRATAKMATEQHREMSLM